MKSIVFRMVFGLIVCAAFLVADARAQPTAFTYQGRLTDSGLAATASYDMQFKLFDTQPVGTGTQQGTFTPSVPVAAANGIFTVELDFGFGVLSTGAPLFLEVNLKPAGSGGAFTTLGPRQRLTSAPYSVRAVSSQSADNASNASSLGGVAANQFVQTNDLRLSNDRSPTAGSSFYIQNQNAAPQSSSNFRIDGTGTAGVFDATLGFNIGGNRVFAVAGSGNTFGGILAGNANTNVAEDNTFFGHSAGQSNSEGRKNSFFGSSAGSSSTGSHNSFFGYRAGLNNLAGTLNSFFGSDAGLHTSAGSENAFFGGFAGQESDGSENSYFGSRAGQNRFSGDSNSFFGYRAGGLGTSGNGNSFFGSTVGLNTTGTGNSFFGLDAGVSNTNGSLNSLFGAHANIALGVFNATALGARAFVTQGNSLILGSISGVNGAIANTNVGIGTTAPPHLLTIGPPEPTDASAVRVGIFNTAGFNLILRENTADVEGFFGVNSSNGVLFGSITNHNVNFRTNGTTRMAIDGAGNIGIGTTVPTEKLHVVGNGLFTGNLNVGGVLTSSGSNLTNLNASNITSGTLSSARLGVIPIANGGTGSPTQNFVDLTNAQTIGGVKTYSSTLVANSNVGIGNSSPLNLLSIGPNPEATTAGASIGVFTPTGTGIVVRETTNDVEGLFSVNSSSVLYGSTSNHNTVFRTNNSARMTITAAGDIMVGTGTPADRLHVNGIIRVATLGAADTTTALCRNSLSQIATCNASSLRYKSDITPFAGGMDLVQRLRPINFSWRQSGVRDVGFGAEDVAKIEQLFTFTNEKNEVEGVRYDRLGVVFVNAFKEQQAQIEAQQKEIEELKTKVVQIDELKRLVCAQNKAPFCREDK